MAVALKITGCGTKGQGILHISLVHIYDELV